jgi:RimJ/RimL family protein N-acetyltransferase
MGVEHPDDLKFAFRSERLVFRALEDNEVDRQFVFEINNDTISTGMGSPKILKPAPTSDFEVFKAFIKPGTYTFIACLPPLATDADGKETTARTAPQEVGTTQLQQTTPIGFVALVGGSSPEIMGQRCSSLAVSVMTRYAGTGYGGEMINWVLDWGFRRLSLHRIQLNCMSFNVNAIKLYRKLGFVEEGRSRETRLWDRKWADTLHFGMLEHEWEKLRGIST